ncbi:MAG: acetate kinase [Campylobacterota bacterium]|nr:acetate kinase [Campylobacterota bacterium]
MKIAVINAGSSSLKVKLFDMENEMLLYSKLIEQIGEEGSDIQNHHQALQSLDIEFDEIDGVGHRVVHGAEHFSSAVLINDEVKRTIESLIPLAPLHNGANLEGIVVMERELPNTPQVAVFDTAFHATLPKEAYLYALPMQMYEKHHIRRYGFHGTSHSFVSKKAAELLQKDPSEVNLITLHLGNGASVCAIKNGKSIETSMGFTPLEGLVMGTRSGDVDPSIVLYMQKELGMSIDEVEEVLNKKSGLKGICNDNDLRKILKKEDENSKLALAMMIRRIQKYIGSYMVLLENVDGVVFTGGIGENSSYIREKIMDNKIVKNLKQIVVKTDEELEIATQTLAVIEKR